MTQVLRDYKRSFDNHNSFLFNSTLSPDNKFQFRRFEEARSEPQIITQLPTPSLNQLNGLFDLALPPRSAKPHRVEQKKVYYCQRCLNHGRAEPRKNHKCECPFANCACSLCILVERRRKLNSQLHDLEGTAVDSVENLKLEKAEEDEDKQQKNKKERVPNCQKCGQHGRKSRLKGHKRVCPFKDCDCPKCQVVSERQKLMADQIKIRRRQKKDTLMNITREHITTTLNYAAALAAGIPTQFSHLSPPAMPAINAALLYSQFKSNGPSSLLTSPASSDGSSYSPQSQLGSAFTATTASPEILKAPLVSPSPPSPNQAGIVAPVAINPSTPTATAFNFSTLLPTDALLQLLQSYKFIEQKLEPETIECSNPIIDVCSV